MTSRDAANSWGTIQASRRKTLRREYLERHLFVVEDSGQGPRDSFCWPLTFSSHSSIGTGPEDSVSVERGPVSLRHFLSPRSVQCPGAAGLGLVPRGAAGLGVW